MTFNYCSILVCNLTCKWSGPCLKLFCSGLCIIDFYAAVLHYQEQCTVSEIKGIYMHTCAYGFDPPMQSAIMSFRNGKREERWEGRPRGRHIAYKL